MGDLKEVMVDVDDRKAREDIVGTFGETLFVEAGAGTGKTTAMIHRIVQAIKSGHAEMEAIVMMTFTEEAASEFRQRLRVALQQAFEDTKDSIEGSRIHTAQTNIDRAQLVTIHAFAGDLLRRFAFQLHLPVHITVQTPVASRREEAGILRKVLEKIAEPSTEVTTFALLRCCDISTTKVARLVSGMYQAYDLLEQHPLVEPSPMYTERWIADFQNIVLRLEELGLIWGNMTVDHPTTHAMHQYLRWAKGAFAANTVPTMAFALRGLLQLPKPKRGFGNEDSWRAAGGDIALRKTATTILEAEVIGACRSLLQLLIDQTLAAVCVVIREVVLDAAHIRRRLGKATFDDLLVWTRDMLCEHKAIRDRLHDEIRLMIVDEFQDTDPLQAEIIWRLAADKGHMEADWTSLPLTPGWLCVVGDPKQSIYRFRSADVQLYQRLQSHVIKHGGSLRYLTTNFRSHPDILRLVNLHFSSQMDASDLYQATYISLNSGRTWAHQVPDSLSVIGEAVEGTAATVWQREAEGVANCISDMVAAKQTIVDPISGKQRPCTYADFCVLTPRRTNTQRIERACADRGIPIVLKGGTLLLRTQEVRDLVTTLRAIWSPTDAVAVLGTLRSAFWGCTDPELLNWWSTHKSWDYRTVEHGDDIYVAYCFQQLTRYYEKAKTMSFSRLIRLLLHERGGYVNALTSPSAPWLHERMHWVGRMSQEYEQQDLFPTLGGFLTWVDTIASHGTLSGLPTLVGDLVDAVTVTTVHGAKGLEYPIVVLTGLGAETKGGGTDAVLVDRSGERIAFRVKAFDRMEAKLGPYDELKALSAHAVLAEEVRLHYVAMTRARDHLVVSVYRKKGDGDDRAAGKKKFSTLPVRPALLLEEELSNAFDLHASSLGSTAALLTIPDEHEERVDEKSGPDFHDWEEKHQAFHKHVHPPTVIPITRVAEAYGTLFPDQGDRQTPKTPNQQSQWEHQDFTTERGDGKKYGSIVHDLLRRIGERSIIDIQELGVRLLSEAHLSSRISHMKESLQWMDTLMHGEWARYTPYREIPLSFTYEEIVLQGTADLILTLDSTALVVDYKTDAVQPFGKALSAYVTQCALYSAAIYRHTRYPVEGAVLLLLGIQERLVVPKDVLEARSTHVHELFANHPMWWKLDVDDQDGSENWRLGRDDEVAMMASELASRSRA